MTDMVCCPLDGGGDEPPEFYRQSTVTARKEYHCCECRETIPRNAKHERVTAKWSGRISTMRSCLSCVEIRNHFACNNGWVFGEVWSQLEDNFFPDMKAGGPCMQGLSPEAKARLFERRLQWLEVTAS